MAEEANSPITVPSGLLPADGRFGCGPSKVRPAAVAALADTGTRLLGTSHRQAPIKWLVKQVKEGVQELFGLPDDYQVVLGNGGSTAFWDIAAFSLVRNRSQHCVFGEFSSKFAAATKAAPWLEEPELVQSDPGTHPTPHATGDVDVYALTHNETSTGVAMPVMRIPGANDDSLIVVDATSGAGGLVVDPSEFDVYYFAPQKCFASDGGLWIAAMSPAALERVQEVKASGRYIPTFLDLATAVDNSAKDQTYNTPAVATLFLLADQLGWLNEHGGLTWATERSARSAAHLYSWAEKTPVAEPFVSNPAQRSNVVGTIDFIEGVNTKMLAATLRANGIVDTEPYRKLGRNQLRIGMFPAIDPADVEALTTSIDYILDRL
ncbi:MAG: phosphoserine transaminase [Streptosporangiales bacterium]|nr:phosphoserine transaminase [Streptosporangiales bacterium]